MATAGADGVVVLFDREAGRIRASLTGHSKKVNGELFRDFVQVLDLQIWPSEVLAAHQVGVIASAGICPKAPNYRGNL